MEEQILKIAKRLQSIAQAGIYYSRDNFDKERYQEIRDLSILLLSIITYTEISKIKDLFTCESGFQTPKIDVRAVIIERNKILLTRERADEKWSLPGGFADINLSPRENVEKEVFEETGITATANRLLAIIDTNKHGFPPLEFHYYKLVILCDYISGIPGKSNETYESNYFEFDNLPDLSLQRNTPELFKIIQKQINELWTFLD